MNYYSYLTVTQYPLIFPRISPASDKHHYTFTFYKINFFQILYMHETTRYLSLCTWLSSSNIMTIMTPSPIHSICASKSLPSNAQKPLPSLWGLDTRHVTMPTSAMMPAHLPQQCSDHRPWKQPTPKTVGITIHMQAEG